MPALPILGKDFSLFFSFSFLKDEDSRLVMDLILEYLPSMPEGLGSNSQHCNKQKTTLALVADTFDPSTGT